MNVLVLQAIMKGKLSKRLKFTVFLISSCESHRSNSALKTISAKSQRPFQKYENAT